MIALKRFIAFVNLHPFLTGLVLYAAVAAVYAVATDGVLRDDAYIFFQYARNWSQTGVLAFNAGEPSYGITSILWLLILTAGSFVVSDIVMLAKLLGVIFGALGTVFWARWIFSRLRQPFSVGAVLLAALLPAVGAGRMVMGMETSLACFISGWLVLASTGTGRFSVWYSGLAAGLLALVRPELAVGAAALCLYLAFCRKPLGALKAVLTAAVVTVGWPLWLYAQNGAFLPPTRNGKLSVFLPESLGITLVQFEAGSLSDRISWGVTAFAKFATGTTSHVIYLLLLAATLAVLLLAARKLRARQFGTLCLPVVATLLVIGLYCFQFPLLKLRYFVWLLPALAVSFFAATRALIPVRWHHTVEWTMTIALLLVFYPAVKHRVSSTDVQQIRRAVGEVVNAETPPGARIALEPIGEFGFYAERYIVDMGGLISSTTPPYIRNGYSDVDRIWECLVNERADYLVTYDHDGFLGRLPKAYPDRFETVAYVPENEHSPQRYRILRILHGTDEIEQGIP